MNSIIWFRRDVRIHDNPALNRALEQGANKAIFISTPEQWQKHHMAPVQADFIARHLRLLSSQLAAVGIELIHLHSRDFRHQAEVLQQFCQQNNISQVFANTESGVNEEQRDDLVAKQGINLLLTECETILPPGSVVNQQGQMYRVFTPFKKAWLQQLRQRGIDLSLTPEVSDGFIDQAELAINFDYPMQDSSRWPLADRVMSEVVEQFLQFKLDDYGNKRDFPGIKATSGLSPYLAIGAISVRWLTTRLIQREPEIIEDQNYPGFAWLNELIWRDFYKHLLFHFPDLSKGKSFQPKYQNMHWHNNPEHFQAWCEGRTGYPIVDAAMNQLRQTGWMHNRLRMIVASFLTKHLLIDWRWGEQFFMSQLIDGDLSANNGGWQWAAGTGCDAQPYFRIFNPLTQSKKFDPNGDFIRRYIPELNDVPDKVIHFPYDYLLSRGEGHKYPAPIVEHSEARQRALEFYKQYQ
ncbi:deoxyribodipyrimidine photo-lyase [Vibrio sp. SCSIO 43137]|uniref:deoxyribodipyrimidine photo-lyase n=1 Tax=Vibrio sp. SCSIO 43137 TaxID=3021011 RepID=UPI0023074F92|nr:deoxyribodipyrimidine photo-lyase [Vibrio sp. SCSIO 43137]WCE31937.1 deoxyribodipyrimidine photo-lyase [Vibrio sp. SCSIO 43137]